ncbi:MAG: GYD domain-containing protein [Chloroflexi bacterium]|nr:GYD domain-containing protein [Chloroflexota bacterium]
MPHYMFQATYTAEAWEGLVRRPQDRARAIRLIVKNLKGRVISFYNSFGDYDVVIIAEMPNNEAAAGLSMAAAAGGAVKAVKTTPLMTVKEGLDAMRKADKASYQRPK